MAWEDEDFAGWKKNEIISLENFPYHFQFQFHHVENEKKIVWAHFIFPATTRDMSQACQRGNWVSHFHDKLISFFYFFLISKRRDSVWNCHICVSHLSLWTLKNGEHGNFGRLAGRDHWHESRRRGFKWISFTRQKSHRAHIHTLDTFSLVFCLAFYSLSELKSLTFDKFINLRTWHDMQEMETIFTFYSCQGLSSGGGEQKKAELSAASLAGFSDFILWYILSWLQASSSPYRWQARLTEQGKRIFQSCNGTRCSFLASEGECWDVRAENSKPIPFLC